ncbi:DNA-binding response OmpR family regulator [Methylobacterium sp. PvP062]|uniref:Response regulator receiver protein n=3 Tax=Pseudomonadota TaxID=1224 RepID=B1M685_METRJ|nr:MULTISPECIES: response regulator [Methylobacterium]MBY0251192.1 response regulator [Methylobacterium organophilum]MCX7334087.1 response regulator [Hyphomicrobiales bacterium]ACB22120.1 response regulator receiver protein [Methylobacterium radiotolerans JCM 2831]MBP2492316.1 DNA-binding response OmpR family regulator [Methylobacterium sp. PvP105]MBP2501313.1 DNA-binding response OmpR family regulator [Methylobacterium sp. PvP109]
MVPFAAAFVCPTLPVPDRGVATILVVEDEPTVCELAAEALLDEGYRVLTAADAWEAEAILSRESVDLLFTDIDLARNTDGLSLARCARRLSPDLPVVYTSGGRASLATCEAVPGSVFVPKPYRPSQLVALTQDVLRTAPLRSF